MTGDAREALTGDVSSLEEEIRELIAPFGARRLGEVLRDRRKDSGVSLSAAAEQIDVKRKNLDDIESGRRKPEWEVVAALLSVYGLRPDQLAPKRIPLDPAKLAGTSNEDILRSYVDSIRAWRKSPTKGEFSFRHEDIQVLVDTLGTNAAEIERRLIAITGCSRGEARAFRKRFLVAVSGASVAAVLLSGLALQQPAAASTPAHAATTVSQSVTTTTQASTSVSKVTPATATKTVVGVLQASTLRAATSHAAGVNSVVVAVHWDSFAPTKGSINQAYVKSIKTQIDKFTAAGMRIVLSPGFANPPSWVFGLNANTRFVDQHGTVWKGGAGEDVPDAVFNQAVRQAQDTYLAQLGSALKGMPISSVRVGGLCDGELRYPSSSLHNSYWAFDGAAQAQSPVPGWRPGDPGKKQAAAFASWYLNSLTNYQNFLVKATTQAFPASKMMVLYPSWGVRPGQVEQAVAGGLRGSSPAERNGTLQEGLDWASQVAALPAGTTVYTTNLAAPELGSSVTAQAPVAYLASLATKYHHLLAGENAGQQSQGALTRSIERAQKFHLTDMFWMTENDLYKPVGDGPSLAQLGAAAHLLDGSGGAKS